METDMIYVCECMKEECHTYIDTEDYEYLKGLDCSRDSGRFITLLAHVPEGQIIFATKNGLCVRGEK